MCACLPFCLLNVVAKPFNGNVTFKFGNENIILYNLHVIILVRLYFVQFAVVLGMDLPYEIQFEYNKVEFTTF